MNNFLSHLDRASFVLLCLLQLSGTAWAVQPSRCHAFVDYDFIWTLELVRTSEATTPICNVIALSSGEWEIQPNQIALKDSKGRTITVQSFSFDSGDPENPFSAPYLKLRGGDFAGMDLVGDFSDVDSFESVQVELSDERLIFEALDCDAFDTLLDKIGQIEIGGANIFASFQVLNIQLLGAREVQ